MEDGNSSSALLITKVEACRKLMEPYYAGALSLVPPIIAVALAPLALVTMTSSLALYKTPST